MKDEIKTKEELLDDLKILRKRNRELEKELTEVREKEEKFSSLVMNIPDVIWTSDISANTLFISPNVEQIYGFTSEEIYRERELWMERIHPEDILRVKKAYESLFTENKKFDVEYRIKRKDGEYIWLHDRSVFTYEKDGIKYANGVFTDITQKKADEEFIRDSKERFHAIFEESGIGIAYGTADGTIINFSRAIGDMLGYSKEELKARGVQGITHPDDWEKDFMAFKGLTEGRYKKYQMEKRYIRKDGRVIWGNLTVASIMNREGKACYFIGTVEDITASKAAEEKLHYRLAIEDLLTDISTGFINISDRDLEKEITNTLRIIGEFVGVDRCFIDLFSKDLSLIDSVYEWTAEDFKPHIDDFTGLSLSPLQWLMGKLTSGENIYIPSVKELPSGASEEKKICEAAGAKSLMGIPLFSGVNLIGFLGFTSIKKEKVLQEEDLSLLKLLGQIFVNLLERRDREKRLKKSEERYRKITSSITDYIYTVYIRDGRSVKTIHSPACEIITGYKPEDFAKNPHLWLQMVHMDDWKKVKDYAGRLLSGRKTESLEHRIVHRKGSIKWVRNTPVFHYDREGNLASYDGLIQDITERKMTEEALRESEEKFRLLAEEALTGIIIYQDSRVKFVNRGFCEITGYSEKEIMGWMEEKTVAMIHSDDRSRVYEHGLRRQRGDTGVISRYEYRLVRKDGEIIWVDHFARTIRYEGRPAGLINVIDITKNKLAEEEIRKFKTISDRAGYGNLISDFEGNIIYVNEAFSEMHGYTPEELSGKKISLFHNEEQMLNIGRLIEKLKKEGGFIAEEVWHSRRDGSVFPTLMNAVVIKDEKQCPLYLAATAIDITEQKKGEKERLRLECQLRQAQKMEAIGTLAGGISHDFNNILGAIMGYGELTLDEVPVESMAYINLLQLIKATHRAKDLIKQILAVSRHGEQEKRLININSVVKEALKLLRATLPATVQMYQDFEAETLMTLADPTQIHQIILNLCTNAFQAMEEKGGALEVHLGEFEISPDEMALYRDLKPGPYIKLSVSDTGQGIKKEIMERIFEPYFTTKEVGKGSGLGLAVVHGIVKSYGGDIRVYSEPGKGTTFNVYLPAVKSDMAEEKKAFSPVPGGKESILLVDDEEILVDIGKQMLERLGYKVYSTTGSLEAFEVFKKEPEKFDIVITDQTMPHMTGSMLSEKILSIRPDIPIILCTGYSDYINGEKAESKGIRGFIMKPVSKKKIAEAIRRVLEK